MLAEQMTLAMHGTESQIDLDLLKKCADNLDPTMGKRQNGQTVPADDRETTETSTEQKDQPSDYHFVSPAFSVVRSDFKLLQLWQGRVDEVENDRFIATIFDKTSPHGSPEQISISTEDVEPEDRILLRPGAIFYWSIGYANYTRGPRQRTSRIRFRRLVIPKRKIFEHKDAAKELAHFLSKHQG